MDHKTRKLKCDINSVEKDVWSGLPYFDARVNYIKESEEIEEIASSITMHILRLHFNRKLHYITRSLFFTSSSKKPDKFYRHVHFQRLSINEQVLMQPQNQLFLSNKIFQRLHIFFERNRIHFYRVNTNFWSKKLGRNHICNEIYFFPLFKTVWLL